MKKILIIIFMFFIISCTKDYKPVYSKVYIDSYEFCYNGTTVIKFSGEHLGDYGYVNKLSGKGIVVRCNAGTIKKKTTSYILEKD